MNKIYANIVLLFVATFAFAQPKFTANNCYRLNAKSTVGFAIVSANFDGFISQTGPNYVWDFSSAGEPGPWTSWTNPTIEYTFQPSSQSNHTIFHSTQINELGQVAFPRNHFYTYSPAQDTLYLNGLYTSRNNVYTPEIPYLTFPMSYKDSSYAHTQQINPTPPATVTGSATRYWIYDGYGKIILPYGTVDNVYRIRTKQIDSLYLVNFTAAYEEIIWFRQSDGIPILRFIKQGTLIAAYYASASGTNAVRENTASDMLNIYPNPFNDRIEISNTSSKRIKKITVYDNLGKIVFSENTVDANSMYIENNLVHGLYIIEAALEDNTYMYKLLTKQP